MHLWQAFKMACKSLWTNKLRSFLTMLGIIIGVMTVSLLTTVAASVSDAVISSIRSQSTLSIIMNTSSTLAGSKNTMTYKDLNSILKNEQPKTDAANYFDYAMIYSTSGAVAGELDGEVSEVKDYLQFEKLYSYTKEELEAMTENERLIAYMRMAKQKALPISSSIYAVDKSLATVYETNQHGRFPEADDEILVDQEFVKTYIGQNVSAVDAIGKKVTFGINYYSRISIKMSTMSDTTLENISNYITNLVYPTGVGEDGNPTYSSANLKILSSNYNEESKTLTFDLAYFQTLKNDAVKALLMLSPDIKASADLTAPNAIIVEDKFETKNSKTYTVCGVLKEDESAMFTGMSTSSDDENSLISVMMSSRKGACYMLLDESNLAPIDAKAETVEDVVITYAYLRYKTEDVMSESTTDITIALIRGGYDYMQDFMIVSMSNVAKIISTVMNILTTMLTVISVISLVVGGIGIMNIMLVAVTERTKEIGIRKAIGAKRSSILVQFLVEALMLSLIGGGIGLIISAIGSAIIASVMGIAISMPFWVIAMSLGFCTAIGLIFGMFPAVKASHMQPIEALRRD